MLKINMTGVSSSFTFSNVFLTFKMGVVLTHPVGSLKHQKGQRVVEALWGEVM